MPYFCRFLVDDSNAIAGWTWPVGQRLWTAAVSSQDTK